MNIILNGEPCKIEKSCTLSELLLKKGYDGKLVAVALNGTFVSKSNYENTSINDNDKIEIVAPMQGG